MFPVNMRGQRPLPPTGELAVGAGVLLAGRRTRTVDLLLVRGQCLLLPGAKVTLGAPEERSSVGVLFVLLEGGLVRDLEFAQLAAEGGSWPVLMVLSNMVGEVCCKLKKIIVTDFPRKKNSYIFFIRNLLTLDGRAV